MNRVKILRTYLGLSQSEFGKKIGITKSSVSRIEKGETKLTERNIMLICSEFEANAKWIKFGTGDMFESFEDSLEYVVAKYSDNMSDVLKDAVITLLKMPTEKQKVFDEFLNELIELRNKDNKD